MKVSFNGHEYPCRVWKPTLGAIGPCAFDSETTLIVDNQTPEFIIGTVFNGQEVFFLTRELLAAFFALNSGPFFIANAPFDLSVIEKACGLSSLSFIDKNIVIDVLLLFQLVRIAEAGESNFGASLANICLECLGVDLPKDLKDESGNDVRLSFGQFISEGERIQYERIPSIYLQYAALDAVATFFVGLHLQERAAKVSRKYGVDPKSLLSHHIQLKASLALNLATKNGLYIDTDYKNKIRSTIEKDIAESKIALRSLGWMPGEGSNAALQELLKNIEAEYGVQLPRTKTGKISAKGKYLQERTDIPFFKHFIAYKNNSKLLEFLNFEASRIHARFNPIVSTGRTSSFSPNVQNFPRDSRIRAIIAASPGYVFLDVDYAQIELCTLAQITYDKYGQSKMRELLNTNVDLHSYFAAILTGKSYEEIGKDSEDRRKAKACNFGFPGGLGIESFIEYAKVNYEVELTPEEARSYRDKWLDTFPEVRTYLDHNELELLKSSGILRSYDDEVGGSANEDAAVWIFRGIVSGNAMTKTTQRLYTPEEIKWAFQVLSTADFYGKDDYINSIRLQRGSRSLWQAFIRSFNVIIFPSGRIRSNIDYCQLKNNPFQGLAADGAKEALYELIRQGYRVVNFIHDEFLIEVPETWDLKAAESQVKEILISSMSKHCPDVKIKVDAKWMKRWSKSFSLDIETMDRNGLTQGRAGAEMPMQSDGKEVRS